MAGVTVLCVRRADTEPGSAMTEAHTVSTRVGFHKKLSTLKFKELRKCVFTGIQYRMYGI